MEKAGFALIVERIHHNHRMKDPFQSELYNWIKLFLNQIKFYLYSNNNQDEDSDIFQSKMHLILFEVFECHTCQ